MTMLAEPATSTPQCKASPPLLPPPAPPLLPGLQSLILCTDLEAFRRSLFGISSSTVAIDDASMVFTLADEDFCGTTGLMDSAATLEGTYDTALQASYVSNLVHCYIRHCAGLKPMRVHTHQT